MESHSKVLGHPIQTILIAFPLGLLTTSLVFDGLANWRKNQSDAKISRALIGAGVLGGALAAVPGIIDYLAIPHDTRAKRVGLVHGSGNVLMLLFFALSWKKRRPNETQPSTSAVALSLLAGAIMSGTGWLGGEMVYRLGIGVDEGAHPEAPNSLVSDKA